MHLSACIEWLFTEEEDFAARIALAAAAGVSAVEFWGWREKDVEAISAAARASASEVTCFCCDPEGNLTDPATHADFMVGLEESIAVAQALGTRQLIVLAGDAQTGAQEADDERPWDASSGPWRALHDGLSAAAEIAEREGAVLLLEPLNTKLDHPGHFLNSTERALDLLEALDRPALRLLLDVYHSQMMGEPPPDVLLRGREQLLGHVHVADAPGRHEPGTGEIDWGQVIGSLRASGYDGAIGLEFEPSAGTLDAMHRLRAELALDG